MPKLAYIIYLAVLLFSVSSGVSRYTQLNKPSKLIVIYLAITFLVESIAIGIAFFHKNPKNLFLYHVYSPAQFLFMCLYFSYSDKHKFIRKIGWILAFLGIVASVVNTILLQPITELNTNFIVLESFLAIGMSLFAFYKLLASDIIDVHLNPRFWFSSIFLVFWSFTFFYWLVGVTIYNLMPDKAFWLNAMILFINIAAYSGFGVVFLLYKKMKTA